MQLTENATHALAHPNHRGLRADVPFRQNLVRQISNGSCGLLPLKARLWMWMWMWIWDVQSRLLTAVSCWPLVGVGGSGDGRWCLKFLQVNQPVSFSCSFVIFVCVIFVIFLLLLTKRPTDRPNVPYNHIFWRWRCIYSHMEHT